jgi:hypothetical protein
MSDWNSYLARGIPARKAAPSHRTIYHMTERSDFENQTKDGGVSNNRVMVLLLTINIHTAILPSNIRPGWFCSYYR